MNFKYTPLLASRSAYNVVRRHHRRLPPSRSFFFSSAASALSRLRCLRDCGSRRHYPVRNATIALAVCT
jgi:hypothetical protein